MLVYFALGDTNSSQWKIGGVGSSGVGHVYFMYISCIFHVVCAPFSALDTRELADAKAYSGGIWALVRERARAPVLLITRVPNNLLDGIGKHNSKEI